MTKYNRDNPACAAGYLPKCRNFSLNKAPNSFRKTIFVVIIAVLSAAAGMAMWGLLNNPRQPADQTLIELPEPWDIPAVTLIDQDGQPFGPDELRGQWSLLFFGFTHCPDVCPTTLYDLHQVKTRLQEQHGVSGDDYQVVFVSVDPERDTPQKLRDYVAYFDPSFLAVTGEHDQLRPLTRKLAIAYRIEEHEAGAAAYNVDHSVSILLASPEARIHGIFPAPHDIDKMAAALGRLID
jgi:protein SCO1/2